MTTAAEIAREVRRELTGEDFSPGGRLSSRQYIRLQVFYVLVSKEDRRPSLSVVLGLAKISKDAGDILMGEMEAKDD